jgi:hypothetical protein
MDIVIHLPPTPKLPVEAKEAIIKMSRKHDLGASFLGEKVLAERLESLEPLNLYGRKDAGLEASEALDAIEHSLQAVGVSASIHCDASGDGDTYDWNHKAFTRWKTKAGRDLEMPAGALDAEPLIEATKVLKALADPEAAKALREELEVPLSLGLIPGFKK